MKELPQINERAIKSSQLIQALFITAAKLRYISRMQMKQGVLINEFIFYVPMAVVNIMFYLSWAGKNTL